MPQQVRKGSTFHCLWTSQGREHTNEESCLVRNPTSFRNNMYRQRVAVCQCMEVRELYMLFREDFFLSPYKTGFFLSCKEAYILCTRGSWHAREPIPLFEQVKWGSTFEIKGRVLTPLLDRRGHSGKKCNTLQHTATHFTCSDSRKCPFTSQYSSRPRSVLEAGFRTLWSPFVYFVPLSRAKPAFWISTRTAPGPISQVVPGCWVRHPQYSKKLFVRCKRALAPRRPESW